MKRIKYVLAAAAAAVMMMCLCSCGGEDIGQLILSDSFSPNEEYVSDESELITYTIDVYQNSDNLITVKAYTGDDSSDAVEYQVQADAQLTEDDYFAEWLTADGSYEQTEDNLYSVCDISLSSDGNIYSEQTVDFINGKTEMILGESAEE